MNGKHLSLDIEACGEVLLSVGACYFNIENGEPYQEFYGALQVQPQLDTGLKMSGSAWEWWLKQSDDARKALVDPRPPTEVLFKLWQFVRGEEKKGEWPWVWAYPTSFDLPVIERACKTFSVDVPWKWTKTLDGRTLWNIACSIDSGMKKIEEDAKEIPHHALGDAKQQARWYSRYLRAIPTYEAVE